MKDIPKNLHPSLTDLLSQSQALGVGDRRQLLFLQLLDGFLLVPQIQLGAHQDDRCGGAVVTNLGVPLAEDKVKKQMWVVNVCEWEEGRGGEKARSQEVKWVDEGVGQVSYIVMKYILKCIWHSVGLENRMKMW